MIRQFRIIGLNTGVEYSLNDFNKYLLTLPSGIGFEYENKFISVGSQRINVERKRKYNPVGGTIEVSGSIRDDWEKNYNELRNFVSLNIKDGFKLYYKNRANEERYILCDLKLLEKTEKSSYAILVPIQLEPKSLWLTDVVVNSNVEEQKSDKGVMAFLEDDNFLEDDEYRYNYGFYEDETGDYVTKFFVNQVGVATLINNSDDETPLIITIYGKCNNPYFQLIDVNNDTIQAGRIYVNLDENEKLILDSNPDNLSITAYKNIGEEQLIYDITTDVDISLKNYITLPIGTYTLKFLDDDDNVIKANIQFRNKYLGG